MFATIKQIFAPKNKEIRKKILFTLAVLFVFRLGTAIVIPGVNVASINNLGFLELLNFMGGGALKNYSIFALGVSPYITASIIIQLLEMDIVPYLTELSKQGGTGRAKLNQITRITGIILAFFQGYMFSFTFIKGHAVMEYMLFSLVLTAGTCFVMWMADQVTSKGIGNGTSIIIMAGIIAELPNMFKSAFVAFNASSGILGILLFVLYVLVYIALIIGIIYIEISERRIPIQYSNKTSNVFSKNQNYIPFKLNSAGVMPVIFSSILVSIPGVVAGFINKEAFTNFVNKWLTMSTGTGFVLYIIFIFAFSYFYTFLQIKPKEMAENLNKNGGYIPGIRPGNETVNYVTKVLKNLTCFGALSLAFLAALPIIFGIVTKLGGNISIGGTGMLIVIGVCLETYKQLESQLVSHTYKRGRRRR
jgi:preprotein translocase subunit SecY